MRKEEYGSMNSMEIVLLVIGALVFVASFLIPTGKGGSPGHDREIAIDEIRSLVDREFDRIRDQVDDAVEDAVRDSMERAERSLERVSDEKIRAASEYSDTVLGQINKSQQEITFLYDMLNAKHDSLKNTALEVDRKIKAAETAGREADAAAREVQAALRETEAATQIARQVVEPAFQSLQATTEEAGEGAGGSERLPEEEISAQSQEELQGTESYSNKNDKILELHRQGWSDVTIARQLDLGVGEVKLVIDLFEGRNNS